LRIDGRAHGARLRIDSVLLGERERARECVGKPGLCEPSTSRIDQIEPFELVAGLEAVAGRPERQLGDAAGGGINERAVDGLRGACERIVERRVAKRIGGREPCFGQVHQRVLQRAAAR
jgi:hypothetical protein